MEALEFYRKHDLFSDPGEYAGRYLELPTEMNALHAAINDLLIHNWKVERDRPGWIKAHPQEVDVFTRPIRKVLERVASLGLEPWNQSRPSDRRVVIDCRHFSLLLCSVLRERGIPARTRCGFATYLEETHWMDHWVCEFWEDKQRRWVMEDADLQLHSVPSNQFYTGIHAWEVSRKMPSMAWQFGYSKEEHDRGAWVARANLVRDFAALNGFVSISGDSWELGDKTDDQLDSADFQLLDEIVRLGDDNATFEQRQALYAACQELRPGETIKHFDYLFTNQPREIQWSETL
jgi:Transglutaminase-like superfamily